MSYSYELIQSEYPSCPNDWEDDDCFLVYDHRDFTVERDDFEPQKIFDYLQGEDCAFDDYHVFPVYAFIHSGITLSLNKPDLGYYNFDVSFKGFILVRKDAFEGEGLEQAQQLIDLWNDYLSGNIYDVIIKKDDEIIEIINEVYGEKDAIRCADEYIVTLNKLENE